MIEELRLISRWTEYHWRYAGISSEDGSEGTHYNNCPGYRVCWEFRNVSNGIVLRLELLDFRDDLFWVELSKESGKGCLSILLFTKITINGERVLASVSLRCFKGGLICKALRWSSCTLYGYRLFCQYSIDLYRCSIKYGWLLLMQTGADSPIF